MKKLLIILALLISANVNAFDLSKYKGQVSQELEKHSIKLDDLKKFKKDEIIAIVNQIKTVVKNKDFKNLSLKQLDMLKQAYTILKNAKVKDPELQKIMNKAIIMIDKTGIFNNKK